jgi:hypothetical protein
MGSSQIAWAWPWWSTIVIINIINIIICGILYSKSINQNHVDKSNYLKAMRVMGLVFVIVALYRAVFVSKYLNQMAWFDTFANNSLLIRIFAIAAELSFCGLFALSMLRLNKELPTNNKTQERGFRQLLYSYSPYILVSCIFIAQFFATSGLITKNKTLFAIEESLWTFGFLSVIPLAVSQYRRVYSITDKQKVERLKMFRSSTKIVVIWCFIYCSYGLFYHLPFENWTGALNQMETGIPLIKSGTSAISDAFSIVNETKEYSLWGFGFLLWHSAYFTICVWIALALMQAPRLIRIP